MADARAISDMICKASDVMLHQWYEAKLYPDVIFSNELIQVELKENYVDVVMWCHHVTS